MFIEVEIKRKNDVLTPETINKVNAVISHYIKKYLDEKQWTHGVGSFSLPNCTIINSPLFFNIFVIYKWQDTEYKLGKLIFHSAVARCLVYDKICDEVLDAYLDLEKMLTSIPTSEASKTVDQ